MFHMTNGRGHIKYKNDVLLIAVYKTETNFYFEIYETNVYREILGKDELESDTGTLVILKGLTLYNVM